MSQSAPTIRSRLNLLVLACVGPAFVMAFTYLYHDYARERSRLERDSIATARAMVHALDRELVSARAAGEALSTSPHLQSGDLPAFHAQARALLDRQIGSNVVLSNRAGQQLVNTLREPTEALPRHGNPAMLKSVFVTGSAVISDLYTGAVWNGPLMSLEVPVFRHDEVVYGLSIGMFPDRFAKLLRSQRLPSNWIGGIFDGNGTLAARTHEPERFVGKKGSPELIRRMTEVHEDALETVSVEGIPLVSVFSRSPNTGWAVAIGIPKAELLADLHKSLLVLVAATAALLLGSLGLAAGVGRGITRSIQGLLEPARKIGLHQEVAFDSSGLREADEVGLALARASRMVRNAEHRAQHDDLTGLPNRAFFEKVLTHQVAVSNRSGSPLSVLYVDLDGFKEINDTHGHNTGDKLLQAVGARLKSQIRSSDVAARLGGDEFALLLVNTGLEGARTVAEKLIKDLSHRYAIDSLDLQISASIGVAPYPAAGASGEALLKNADKAMYQAKSSGKRRYVVAA